MVKCLPQEHNMLVTAGLEPATFGLRESIPLTTSPHIPCIPTKDLTHLLKPGTSELVPTLGDDLALEAAPAPNASQFS